MSRPTLYSNKTAMNIMLTTEAKKKLIKVAKKKKISPSDLMTSMILEQL